MSFATIVGHIVIYKVTDNDWSLRHQRIFRREIALNLRWSYEVKLWVDQSPCEIVDRPTQLICISERKENRSKKRDIWDIRKKIEENGSKRRAANIWREFQEVWETHYYSFLQGGKSGRWVDYIKVHPCGKLLQWLKGTELPDIEDQTRSKKVWPGDMSCPPPSNFIRQNFSSNGIQSQSERMRPNNKLAKYSLTCTVQNWILVAVEKYICLDFDIYLSGS